MDQNVTNTVTLTVEDADIIRQAAAAFSILHDDGSDDYGDLIEALDRSFSVPPVGQRFIGLMDELLAKLATYDR